MKRKVVINALPLLSSLTGIGKYTYSIATIVKQKKEYECEFFYGYFSKQLIDTKSNKKVKSLKSYIVQNQFLKAIVRKVLFSLSGLFSKEYDLYWEPNFIPMPSIKAKKIVTTVHDFSWEIYPEFQPKERVEYFQKYFYQQLIKSNHIITGSNFTKNEIIQNTGFDESKISVIYHGVNHNIFFDRRIKKPEQKYILAVGSIEPRKNLINLLMAYAKLTEALKNEYKLILVGASGWNNSEIKNLMAQMKESVKYSGFVSDEELAILYNQASLFVYPSIYEGFGIPPLESMACGTPVVCSYASSVPEVGGDAVVYCNPLNVEDIKEKIEMVLSDEALQQEMLQKGLQRAQMFSWKKAAEKHVEIFEEVLKS